MLTQFLSLLFLTTQVTCRKESIKAFLCNLCNCHTQQLAILDTFEEINDEEDLTMLEASDTCKRLAQHLHKSPLAKMLLEHECQTTNHYPKSIPQANETR